MQATYVILVQANLIQMMVLLALSVREVDTVLKAHLNKSLVHLGHTATHRSKLLLKIVKTVILDFIVLQHPDLNLMDHVQLDTTVLLDLVQCINIHVLMVLCYFTIHRSSCL